MYIYIHERRDLLYRLGIEKPKIRKHLDQFPYRSDERVPIRLDIYFVPMHSFHHSQFLIIGPISKLTKV